MKRKILILLVALLSAAPLLAQENYSPCYNAAFAEGQKQFNAGNYAKAKTYFNEAKNCPDPNTAAANQWIARCNKAIEDAAQRKKEKEAAKTAYMNISKVEYCNVDNNGKMLDDYGAVFRPATLKCLQPRLTYDALLDETREAVVYIKVINPKGSLVTGKKSPSGYTYSASVTVYPGHGKTLALPSFDNNGLNFAVGTYKFELWHDDNRIFASSFKVEEDLKVEEPKPQIVVVEAAEKKAEIKVTGSDGRPLEGARLVVVATGKYELTNSDGIGRIDMSDRDYKTIEVSHADYKDKRELQVHVGDNVKVGLYQGGSHSRSGLNVVHYIVPGLGQMKVGKTMEGVAFMGGEVLLVAGGVVSNSIAQKQLKTMQNENITLADFQSARKSYNTQRVANIACYSAAAILYAAHLYRTFDLASKEQSSKRFSVAPAVVGFGDEMAIGVNINMTF